MEMPESDIEKIKLITVTTQINDLIILLCNIDKESLIASINSVQPENRTTPMYKFLIHALDFYDKIEKELQQGNNENDNQFSFKF